MLLGRFELSMKGDIVMKWRTVKEIPMYEVSEDGDIRNSRTGRILKIHTNNNGYMQVCLRKDKHQVTRSLHRLVADAFFDGENYMLDVNHKDGNKQNNHVGNLEFCTRKENIRHAFDTGLKAPSRQKKVRVIETGMVYESIRECARQIGVNQSIICQCLNGRQKSANGYHFERVE